jgi:hypothetical protein
MYRDYENMTIDEKRGYVYVISKLLGLSADATIERITPRVAAKVDEFLREANRCTFKIRLFGALFTGAPQGLFAIIKNLGILVVLDILEKIVSKSQNIGMPCYFALKRKYAQEVQYIFFEEGIGGIYG